MAAASPLGVEDLGLQRDVWQGHVPCVFSLAPEEITTMSAEPPRSHYMLLPRHSYLPSAAAMVIAHFKAFAPAFARDHEAWFEVDGGQPLKWHLPIGVLFDLHGRPRAPALPWPIVLHFQHFPRAELLATDGDALAAAKYRYLNSLKQMLFLKHGRAGIKWVQSLSAAEQAQLWNSVAGNNVDMYLQVTRQLQALPVTRLPIRVALPGLPLLQRPVRPAHDDGRALTLGDALLLLLPHMFRRAEPDPAAGGTAASGEGGVRGGVAVCTGGESAAADGADGAGGAGGAAAPPAPPTAAAVEPVESGTAACVQGVFPALDTPLLALCQLLSHPDAGLYITITS